MVRGQWQSPPRGSMCGFAIKECKRRGADGVDRIFVDDARRRFSSKFEASSTRLKRGLAKVGEPQ